MTAPAPARAASHRPHPGRLPIALAVACAALLLVDGLPSGPSWMHWVASPLAIITALAVLVSVGLGWDRTVSAARAAGLVAGPDDAARHVAH